MTDQEYMRIALQLAEGTCGQTSPNPMVGAVVVKTETSSVWGSFTCW